MVMQYTTMFAERRASMLVDNISSFIESVAGVIVKVRPCCASSLLCQQLVVPAACCDLQRRSHVRNQSLVPQLSHDV